LFFLAQLALGQSRTQKIDSLLDSLYTNHKLNGNVLVAEKGKVIYSRSFGYANEETKEILIEESVFELASCSKQFTAMAIVLLREQKKLALDDELKKYFPELAGYPGVTIRHLLTHTSGLPDYMELMDGVFDKSTIATNRDIITLLSKHQPKALFEPNTKYEYSNTGYALLASVIEKTSSLTYAEYLQKNIFTPLKMKHTFVYTRRLAPKTIAHYAFGYVPDSAKKYVLPDQLKATNMVVWLDGIVGDGTVNSTVQDLLKWDRALYGNKLLAQSTLREVFQAATLKDGSTMTWKDRPTIKYGFGWMLENHPIYGQLVGHGGSWPGYRTYIDRHTTHDKTIIILQNHNDVSTPLASIRAILYNQPLPRPKTVTSGSGGK
jgi:CubicO group peptidase (beta-lactamase class C family)